MVHTSKYISQTCLIAWKQGQTKWFAHGLARSSYFGRFLRCSEWVLLYYFDMKGIFF